VPAFMLKSFAEMEDMPIKRIMVHGEKAAAYMADGYARANGKPGVCMAQMIGASNPVHLRIQSHLGQMTEQEAELDPLVERTYSRAPAFRPEPEMHCIRDAAQAPGAVLLPHRGLSRLGLSRCARD
jgi:hypothetical protein